MKTTAKEIRGTVGRLNNSIFLHDGTTRYDASVRERRGSGKSMMKIIGYTYAVVVDGVKYVGKAKGPQEFITLVSL